MIYTDIRINSIDTGLYAIGIPPIVFFINQITLRFRNLLL